MSGEHGEPVEVCGAMILKTRPHRFVIASCTSVPDAVRIAACLNALNGVTTEALEAGAVRELVKAARQMLFEVARKQIGVEAAKQLVDTFDWPDGVQSLPLGVECMRRVLKRFSEIARE